MHFSHSSVCFGPRVIRGINSSLNNITEDPRGDWKGGSGGCHVTGWVHSNWQKGNNMDLVGNSPCWHGTFLTWVGHICTLGLLSWHWLVDPDEDDWWRRHPANIHKQLGSGDNMRSDKVHLGKRIWRAVTRGEDTVRRPVQKETARDKARVLCVKRFMGSDYLLNYIYVLCLFLRTSVGGRLCGRTTAEGRVLI